MDQDVNLLDLTLGGGTITGPSNLTLSDQSTWTSGTMSGTGVTTIVPGGTLTMDSGSGKGLARTLINNGAATWTGNDILLSGGTGVFQNNGTFTANIAGLNKGIYGSGLPGEAFNNAGTFIKQGGATATIFAPFNNTGLVDVQGGTLLFRPGGSYMGDFTGAAGTVLSFAGENTFAVGSDITGALSVVFGGTPGGTPTGNMTHNGIVNIGGTLELNGNSSDVLTYNGPVTAGSINVLGATHSFNNTLTVPGGTISGGSLANNGTFNWSGSPIAMLGSGSFVNRGLLNLNSTGTAFSSGSGSPTIVNERTGTIRKTGGGTTTIAVPTTNIGFIDSSGGTIKFSAGLTNSSTGTLGGSGTIGASVANTGRVAPGNSPGILTIQGNYTQTASGILEIEVGGLTPGTQHDRLDVIPDPGLPGSGVATLGGALVVPIINGFVPAINDQITFLNANSVVGNFDRYFMVNPAPGRAIQVIRSPTSVDLKFVASTNATQATGLMGTKEWSTVGTWSIPTPPTETDVVSLTNTELTALRVNVANDNAFTDRLNVSGGQATTTLGVQNGKALSATAGIEIDQAGIIELSNGGLSTAIVTVDTGGTLTGNGILYGDLVAGTNVGAANAMVEPGLNGVGSVEIRGSFLQGAGSVFNVDLPGTNAAGTYDSITVQEDLLLDGKLQVDATGLTNGEFVPGAPYQIATVAGTITGKFDRIEVIGRPDLYFDVDYGAPSAAASDDPLALNTQNTVTLAGYPRGDGNQDRVVDDKDASVFAAVLVDSTIGSFDCGENCFATANFLDAYDFIDTTPDDAQTVDFFDLPYFAAAMSQSSGVSLAAAYAQIDAAIQAAQVSVPEPQSVVLVLLAFAGFLRCRRSAADA